MHHEAKYPGRAPVAETETPNPLDTILSRSATMAQVKSLVRQVAGSDITVLVTGESGTGKELVARAIHDLSLRRNGPMVTINCGAIPEGIFESEVFGHEKGSFTSADRHHQGYFEMANRGTLFLDEIGEMPFQVQVKLLRVLETGKFLKVGGSRELHVKVRVIAATNKDLGTEVNQGKFRSDLFYRLKAISINVPPLRERPEDIADLALHFAIDFAQRNHIPKPRLSPDAVNLLKSQYWSGNVRELKNFMESIVALNPDRTIDLEMIQRRLSQQTSSSNLPMVVSQSTKEPDSELIFRTLLDIKHDLATLKGMVQHLGIENQREIKYPLSEAEEIDSCSLEDMEREQVRRVLAEYDGNRVKAAAALGIGLRTLFRKLKQYNLK